MKSRFRAYYSPTDVELADIWENGLVILDANALLNLFRYTPTTRRDFFRVLDSREESLWIPHQVGLEFHRNRHNVIADQRNAFSKTLSTLEGIQREAETALDKLEIKRHGTLDVGLMKSSIRKAVSRLSKKTEQLRELHESASGSQEAYDETLAHLTRLYTDRVGQPYSQDQLAKIYIEGKSRYALKAPPGYKDAAKGEPAMYGDLVLWKQILDVGSERQKHTIFVTDDLKEDWWLQVAGQTKGARPELVDEYCSSTGHLIHFYPPERFLEFAGTTGVAVSPEAQAEVEEVSDAGRRAAATWLPDGDLWDEEGALLRRRTFDPRSTDPVPPLLFLAHATRSQIARILNQVKSLDQRINDLEPSLFDGHDGSPSTPPLESVMSEIDALLTHRAGLLVDLGAAQQSLDEVENRLRAKDAGQYFQAQHPSRREP